METYRIFRQQKVWRFALLLVLQFSLSCKTPNLEQSAPESSKYSEYQSTFREIKELLKEDGKNFWGKELYGPILLVDPATREIIANENNHNNNFKKSNSIFLDTLPNKFNIANTAFDWDGKRWTMVMLPLPKDPYERNKLLIHEMFHRIQPELEFGNINEGDNSHLDTFDGRLLLLLELEAVKMALASETKKLREEHIKNALKFRKIRQDNEEIRSMENSLEMNEGLAEYTAVMLSGENEKEVTSRLIRGMENFSSNPTFVRSFAYQTIPAYGILLARQNPGWHKNITAETILTDLFMESFAVKIPPNISVQDAISNHNYNYNYNEIVKDEKKREEKRLAKLEGYKKQFIEDPTLVLNFEQMNISFDPRNITPIEDIGTVYPTLRVSDNWGILTVTEGALLSSDWSKVIVSEPTEIGESTVKGKGWLLELNTNWTVERSNGIFKLQKK